MHRHSIAVIGAGPMGLAAAYQLARDGWRPVVFEADDRIGGMSASFDFNGLPIERFYHFHCVADHALFQILNECGLESRFHWKATSMGFYCNGRVYDWGNPLALWRFPELSLLCKLRYGLHAWVCTRRNRWQSLDKLEATSWIRRWVGHNAYNLLWRNLFAWKFYNHAREVSAAWIWSRIRRVGSSRYNVFREKLGYLEGGSDTLLKAMQSVIEHNGGEIRLRAPVNRVLMENGAVRGVLSNQHVESFDKVISTVPLPYIPRIMPDLPGNILKQIKSIRNIAVVCVIASLRRRLTDNFWLNINDPEMDIPGLVEYTNLRPLPEHIVYVPFYMPSEHSKFQDSNDVFCNKVWRYLKKINPVLTNQDLTGIQASRYYYAQPVCGPGFLKGLPPVQLPVKGLWMADTSYYYPEDRGISESIGFGKQIARDVVQSSGRAD